MAHIGNRSLKLLSTTSALALALSQANANPTGGQVAAGSATFVNPALGNLLINQTSSRAILNWQTFSIGQGESTQFAVPTGGSTLNRVVTDNPSAIYGSLSSNGQLILVNPAGIVVGPAGTINTAGLILTTRNIADSDYLAGNLAFSGHSAAAVINQGAITSTGGGDVFIIAKQISNTGSISAPGGNVGMSGATDVVIGSTDTGATGIMVRPSTTTKKVSVKQIVQELQAAGGNHYALAVNNTGVVRATHAVTQERPGLSRRRRKWRARDRYADRAYGVQAGLQDRHQDRLEDGEGHDSRCGSRTEGVALHNLQFRLDQCVFGDRQGRNRRPRRRRDHCRADLGHQRLRRDRRRRGLHRRRRAWRRTPI